jgi:hypothetical protein
MTQKTNIDIFTAVRNSNLYKSSSRKHSKKWGDNIKLGLSNISCENGGWMQVAQNRVQWWTLVLAALKCWFCYQCLLNWLTLASLCALKQTRSLTLRSWEKRRRSQPEH